MHIINPKKLDDENVEFVNQQVENARTGKLTVKDIIGFTLKEPVTYIARQPCGYIAPSVASFCQAIKEKPVTSIFTALPLYNTVIYPLSAKIGGGKPQSTETFEDANEISLKDFITLVDSGKVIPYFPNAYSMYDTQFIQHFLEPGRPRISDPYMWLIRSINLCATMKGCDECAKLEPTAKKDLPDILKRPMGKEDERCILCLGMAYSSGINKEKILQSVDPETALCMIREVIASRNMSSVFKSNCPLAHETLNLFASFPGNEEAVETIIRGLKVKYTKDLDLDGYLSLLDGKTTKAIRETVNKILADPFAAKNSDRLNSKIFEYNREVEEVAKTRSAAFYHAVSEIAVYGGTKLVERQTDGLIKASGKHIRRIQEWIASGLIDIHAKATGKDWTIAQLYKTRCKIEKCKPKMNEGSQLS